MSEKDKPVVDQVLETGGAALELAKVAGGKVAQSVKDGSAQELLKEKIADLKGAAEETTRALKADEITLASVTESFNAESFTGIVSLASSAGITLSVEAVKAVFNQSGGISGVYDHFFNKDKPQKKPEVKPAENTDIMAMLMSGDFSGLTSMAENWFTGIKESLSGGLGSMISKLVPDFDLSGITDMISSIESTVMGFLGGFGGGKNAPEKTVVTVADIEASAPVSRKSGAGLEGTQRPQGDFDRVASTSAHQAAPTAPAPEGPGGTSIG